MKVDRPQKLKICMLICHLIADPNIRVNPQIEICTYLTNFSHQVNWIISLGKDCPPRQFFVNDAKVYDIPYRHYFPGDSLPAKILNLVPNTLRRMRHILKIFREGEYNLIFVRDDPFDGLIAAYLKSKYRIPLVYELSDPLEQKWGAFKTEPSNPRWLYYPAFRFNAWLRVRVMKKADLVLPTTRWFEEALVKKGIPSIKLMSYPNGVDIGSFTNKDGADIRKRYHLNDSRVITYVGAIDRARNLGMLIEAFTMVRQKNWEVKLLMVGDGSDKENLEGLASKLGIRDEVIFTGQVAQSEVPYFIAASDIGVSPVPTFSYYKVSSPIKIFEYMAMAKPVVANEEIFEHKEVLEQSGGGLTVVYTAEAFARAVIELLSDPERARKIGKMGRKWVENNRTYEILARKLESRYYKLYE